MPLRLTAVAAGSGTPNKCLVLELGALTVSDEEMEDIMKIVKSPEELGLFMKDVSETI